ncbi:MAG: protein-glutamate O-methyltransferase CheR [bacterium]|nr:protein-glutamate O-methyltransferase CheR [bacterium]
MSDIKITEDAYKFLRAYIEKECGISLADNKQYLVETRLRDLVASEKCNSYMDLYLKVSTDKSHRLRDVIVDAMTTNETLWFRDGGPFRVFREVLLPQYAEEVRQGKRRKLRIWSAASSTGQEAFSMVMTALEFMRTQTALKPEMFEILGTDISHPALQTARSASYNGIQVDRGLPPEFKERYFEQQGRNWILSNKVKDLVDFKFMNLQDSFGLIGTFDIILVRYVAIYFSDEFKHELFNKVWRALNPNGTMFLGSSETIDHYSDNFKIRHHNSDMYYESKAPSEVQTSKVDSEKIKEMLANINSRLKNTNIS